MITIMHTIIYDALLQLRHAGRADEDPVAQARVQLRVPESQCYVPESLCYVRVQLRVLNCLPESSA